jgi:hypothetical protein
MASIKLNGTGSAVKEIVDRARSIVRLEIELALLEIKAKITKIAVGIGFGAGAAVVAVFALAFLLAGAAAALALVMPLWGALLVVGGVLLLGAGLLGFLSVRSIKAGTPPKPEEAIEEAKLTAETVLQNGR